MRSAADEGMAIVQAADECLFMPRTNEARRPPLGVLAARSSCALYEFFGGPSIIPLHQAKKAKTGAERSRAYRQRRQTKGKAAASPNSESVLCGRPDEKPAGPLRKYQGFALGAGARRGTFCSIDNYPCQTMTRSPEIRSRRLFQ